MANVHKNAEVTHMRAVFFDLETAGLRSEHPIIQIAAAAVARGEITSTYEAKIRFNEADADPEALQLNSYDPQSWTKAITEAEAMAGFADFCRKNASLQKTSRRGKTYHVARGAGHNVSGFDMPRVMDAAKRHDIFMPLDWHALDTMHAAIWYFAAGSALSTYSLAAPPPPASLSLYDLCEHFGITPGTHDALTDVYATVQLAKKIMAAFQTF